MIPEDYASGPPAASRASDLGFEHLSAVWLVGLHPQQLLSVLYCW